MKSWEATRWAKKVSTGLNGEALTRSEKHLLVVLADYHSEATGYAWAALSTLADDTLYSTRQCKRLLAGLKRKGVLWVDARAGLANHYFLNVDVFSVGVTGRSPSGAVDKPVNIPVDNRGQNVPGTHPPPGTFPAPTGDIIVAPDRGHSYGPLSEHRQKEEMRAPQQKIFSEITGSRKWPADALWLKRFLDGPACTFIQIAALDDPPWWDALSHACGGITPEFITDSFAKMKAYILEQDVGATGRSPSSPPRRRPETPGEWKDFTRRWLCRENDWRAKHRAECRV